MIPGFDLGHEHRALVDAEERAFVVVVVVGSLVDDLACWVIVILRVIQRVREVVRVFRLGSQRAVDSDRHRSKVNFVLDVVARGRDFHRSR